MVTSFDEFIKEARDRIRILQRQTPTLNEEDFSVRIVVSGDPRFLTRYEFWQRTDGDEIRLIPTEGVPDAVVDREEFLEEIERTTRMMRKERGNPDESGNPSGNPNGGGADGNIVSDFSGLVYTVRFFVDDDVGRRLENNEFRAETEEDVASRLRFAGPLGSNPVVALEPAGNILAVRVEIGDKTMDGGRGPNSKDAIDDVLDDAIEEILGGSRERAREVFDRAIWSVECR